MHVYVLLVTDFCQMNKENGFCPDRTRCVAHSMINRLQMQLMQHLACCIEHVAARTTAVGALMGLASLTSKP